MLTLTLTTPLTNAEAGAAAALLLTLYPDAVTAALEGLDREQGSLPFPAIGPHTQVVPLVPSPAEAFGTPVMPPEAGAPFVSPPPAPSPSGATPAPPPPTVAVDSTGLPWDARIHSTPSTLTKKGVWRARKNLNQLEAHRVEAELRAALAAPGAPAAPPPPPPSETAAERTAREAVEQGLIPSPPAPVAATPPPPPAPAPAAVPPPPSAASAPPVSPPSPVPPAGSPAPSAPTDDATPPATLFAGAMRKVTAAQTAGHITVEETNAIISQLGLTAVRDLIARPDLVPTFEASVQLHVDRYAPAVA